MRIDVVRQRAREVGFSSAITIDVSSSNTHRVNAALTSSFTIALANAAEGDCGVIMLTQDGTGGRKITSITCYGFTVVMTPDTLTTINTSAFIVASADSVLTYQVIGSKCIVSMQTATTIGYA